MYKLLDELLSETRRLAEEGDFCEYEEFVNLVEQRQQLLDLLERRQEPLTDEFKQKLRLLSELDPVIQVHMNRLKQEAEEGLARLNQAKKQRNAYQTENTMDSFMFDYRK